MKNFNVLFLGVLLFSSIAYSANVVYVDIEFALANTKAGKKAKKEIDQELSKRKGIIERSKSEIVKLEEDFKKQELVLSDKSKEKKKEEYLKKVDELQGLVAKHQQEMQQTEQKIATPILNKMRDVIHKLSKEKGYDLVVTKNALVYADEKLDATQEVIQKFDKEYKN